MTTPLSEARVIQACQTLFGAEVDIGRGFLFYLQPEGLKSAYRKKAKETHPDYFALEPPHIQEMQAMLFRDIVDAYDVVNLFFRQREEGVLLPPSRPQAARRNRHHEKKRDETRSWERGSARAEQFQKPVPFLPMQIGRYLYYRGYITYQALIDAVVWQRKQRPIIGDIALRWGWLKTEEIERIIKAGGLQGRFGEKAVDLNLLSAFQVRVLLYFQLSQQERLGAYFVQRNLLKTEELERLVHELREHNARVLDAFQTSRQTQSVFA